MALKVDQDRALSLGKVAEHGVEELAVVGEEGF
jgi:hypothetical protein